MTKKEIQYLMADRIREIGNVTEIGRRAGCNRNTIHYFLNGTELRYGLFLQVIEALDLEIIVRRKEEC